MAWRVTSIEKSWWKQEVALTEWASSSEKTNNGKKTLLSKNNNEEIKEYF
jgi:hypothetical protein